jgi:ABC-type lipoprotein export system ATPase subunit
MKSDLPDLNREHGKTIVMVTHDPHAADAPGGRCISKGDAARTVAA